MLTLTRKEQKELDAINASEKAFYASVREREAKEEQSRRDAKEAIEQLKRDRTKWRADMEHHDHYLAIVLNFDERIKIAESKMYGMNSIQQREIFAMQEERHLAWCGLSDAKRGRIQLLETAPQPLRDNLNTLREQLRHVTHDRYGSPLLPILQQRLLNLMSGDNGNVERMDIERINKRSAELSDAITTLAPQKKREQAEQYIISWEMCAFDRQGNERIKVLLDGIAKCKAAGDTKTAKDFQKVADVHAAKVSTLKKLAFQASHEACSGRE